MQTANEASEKRSPRTRTDSAGASGSDHCGVSAGDDCTADLFGNEQCSLSDTFEDFWRLYPRRVGKGAAKRAWEKLAPPLQRRVVVILGERIQSDPEWMHAMRRRDLRYIPHPSTWINQERWEDEYPTVPAAGQTNAAYIGHSAASLGARLRAKHAAAANRAG